MARFIRQYCQIQPGTEIKEFLRKIEEKGMYDNG